MSIGFYPYTMIGTFGPPGVSSNNTNWYRIWEAKRWMPFKWALKTGSETNPTFQGVTFFGPYMVVDTNKGISPGPRVTWWLSAPFRFTFSSRVSVKSKRLCGWVTSYSLATLDAEPHLGAQ